MKPNDAKTANRNDTLMSNLYILICDSVKIDGYSHNVFM